MKVLLSPWLAHNQSTMTQHLLSVSTVSLRCRTTSLQLRSLPYVTQLVASSPMVNPLATWSLVEINRTSSSF
jgi:hypothetical protein